MNKMFHGERGLLQKGWENRLSYDVAKVGDDPGTEGLFLDEKAFFLTQRQTTGDEGEIRRTIRRLVHGPPTRAGCGRQPAPKKLFFNNKTTGRGVSGWVAHVGGFCPYDSRPTVYPYSLSTFLLYFFN
ncbi:MAG TPA: hypothetical protein VF646_14225, partial [Cytophagales bacterium]